MRIKKGFVLRDVCGEHVIVGEGLEALNFGRLLCLNETAAWLWRQAAEMTVFDEESLTKKLCEVYDVSEEEALQDVTDILREWQGAGVIDNPLR